VDDTYREYEISSSCITLWHVGDGLWEFVLRRICGSKRQGGGGEGEATMVSNEKWRDS